MTVEFSFVGKASLIRIQKGEKILKSRHYRKAVSQKTAYYTLMTHQCGSLINIVIIETLSVKSDSSLNIQKT